MHLWVHSSSFEIHRDRTALLVVQFLSAGLVAASCCVAACLEVQESSGRLNLGCKKTDACSFQASHCSVVQIAQAACASFLQPDAHLQTGRERGAERERERERERGLGRRVLVWSWVVPARI